jgi:hypothetical protein
MIKFYLNPDNVSRFRSFFVLIQFVFYCLALVQGLKPVRLNDGKVNEDVRRNFWVNNEPKAFFLVKPLDCAFSHTLTDRAGTPENETHLLQLRFIPSAMLEWATGYRGHTKNVKKIATHLFPAGYALHSRTATALFRHA